MHGIMAGTIECDLANTCGWMKKQDRPCSQCVEYCFFFKTNNDSGGKTQELLYEDDRIPLHMQDAEALRWAVEKYERAFESVIQQNFDKLYLAESERLKEAYAVAINKKQQAYEYLMGIRSSFFKWDTTQRAADENYRNAEKEAQAIKNAMEARLGLQKYQRRAWLFEGTNFEFVRNQAEAILAPDVLAAKNAYYEITDAMRAFRAEQSRFERQVAKSKINTKNLENVGGTQI